MLVLPVDQWVNRKTTQINVLERLSMITGIVNQSINDAMQRLNGDSTLDDFKEILEGIQREIETTDQVISKGFFNRGAILYENNPTAFSGLIKAIIMRDDKALVAMQVAKGGLGDDNSRWELPRMEKAALGTPLYGDAATGSYIVPESMYQQIMYLADQKSVMAEKITRFPMTASTVKVPSLADGLTLAWPSDQSSAKSETNPTFSQDTLTAKTCAAWLAVTDELEEDSIVLLANWFSNLFIEAWGAELDRQVLTANADPFTGVLHESDVNTVTMGTGKTSFSDVTIDDLYNMQDAVTKETAHYGAYYIMHRSVFNVVRQIKDDNGNYIYDKGNASTPATIVGVPYILSEVMPKVSDSAPGTPFIAYGNPKYIVQGERKALEFKRYEDTARNVDYDEIFYRFRTRQAFKVLLPSAFSILQTATS